MILFVLAMESKQPVRFITHEALSKRKAKERRESASAIASGKSTRKEIQLRNAPYSESDIRVSKLFGA
jgi:hypothetical protein